MGLDTKIFYSINSFAGINDWIDAFIIFRAEYLPYFVIAGLFGFFGVTLFNHYRHLRKKNLEVVIFALISALVARFGIGEAIRFFINRPRPFSVLSNAHQLVAHDPSHSFPSGHALFYFALSAGVSFYYPKISILFFFAAFSISVGRIAAGLHWPSDIFAGAVLGVGTTLALRYLFLKYKKTEP